MSAISPPAFHANHARGVVLALTGGTMLSLGGPLVRMFEEAGGWTIMFYRGLAFFVMMFLIVCIRSRGRVAARYREIDRIGLAVALCLGCGLIAYVFAMLNTTVANVVFVLGASPLATALLAWLVLKERVTPATGAILCLAAVGVAVMVGEGISAGRLAGNLFALAAVVTFAGFVILLRKARDFDMLAATSLAGPIAAAISFGLADTLAISAHDLAIAIVFGAIQIGLGFTCLTYAARHVSAAELTVLAMSETVLAPVWTWLVAGEVPSPWTLVGGAVVLGCVAGYAALALRRKHVQGVAP